MTQEKSQRNQGGEAGEVSHEFGEHGLGASSSTSSSTSSSLSPSTSSVRGESSFAIPAGSLKESANAELRRLYRALHALSACNQALAQAGSEQELLEEI